MKTDSSDHANGTAHSISGFCGFYNRMMLLPVRTSIPSQNPAIVTWGIMATCVVVFLCELSMGTRVGGFLDEAAFIPARLFDSVSPGQMPSPNYGLVGNVLTMAAAVFMHAGWLHLIGNMWFLFIFGGSVESFLGRLVYPLFFVSGGIAAFAVQAIATPRSVVPIMGASGAIAAVLGAYFAWFPRSRVHTLVILGLFITTVEIPALVFLGFWFVLQLVLGGLTTALGSGSGGVAWFCHIGGFALGFLVAVFIRQYRPPGSSMADSRL